MPAELKLQPNWVLWVPVWTGSKWTKRPVQPSGYGASTTNARHWSTFDHVRQAYERAVAEGDIVVHHKSMSQRVPIGGVGFVFDGVPDENGLVLAGVDFDRVISGDAQIAPPAQERIRRLGSYCEASVSGQGLHVIVKARPLAAGIAHGGVELYTSGRYFTMTGHTGSWSQPVATAVDEFAALAEELRSQSGKARRHRQCRTNKTGWRRRIRSSKIRPVSGNVPRSGWGKQE